MARCIVCRDEILLGTTFCGGCGRSLERASRRDSSAPALIRWAAERARKVERARALRLIIEATDREARLEARGRLA